MKLAIQLAKSHLVPTRWRKKWEGEGEGFMTLYSELRCTWSQTRLSAPSAISYVRYSEIEIRKKYKARQSCVYNSCVCKLWVLCFCLLKGVCLVWYRNLLFSKPPLRCRIIPRGASVRRVDFVVRSKVIFWFNGPVTSTRKLTSFHLVAWIGVKVKIFFLNHFSFAVITVIASDIDVFHFYTRVTI